MIDIRELTDNELPDAMRIKIACFPEETAGLSDIQLDFDKELTFWTKWRNSAEENDDVRLMYGAFCGNVLAGVAFASFIDSKTMPQAGFELNGLWVDTAHRDEGLSIMLLDKLLGEFSSMGAPNITIYNYHHSASNTFYRKFGCKVISTEFQTSDNLPTDIFQCDCAVMREKMADSLLKHCKT